MRSIRGNNDSTNELMPGDVFAVITNDGNYAKVQVLRSGEDLAIGFETYSG